MSLSMAKNRIEQVAECGCKYMDFTGGEPMLNPNLPQLIQYAKSLGIKTEVTTSGAQGMTEVTRQCAGAADKFNISLDTLSADKYRKIRGADRLEQTKEVLREAILIRKEAGLAHVKIMTVVTEENIAEVPDLISFAVEQGAEIYLNPVFSYFEDRKSETETFIQKLERYVFSRNSVIMLHFLEFYRDMEEGNLRPVCSANRQTLTIAADGSLLLPCYHAQQRSSVPIGEELKKYVETEEFLSQRGGALLQCQKCRVTPYFGISFSFRLDKYFLLASFSEKLVHFKRDYLNEFALQISETELLQQLAELKRMVRSLNAGICLEENAFYDVKEMDGQYWTQVYRNPLTREQYEKDLAAEDCWALERVPHREFDRICTMVFPVLTKWLREEPDNQEVRNLLSLAPEWMLRLWKYYICVWFRVSECCYITEDTDWMNQYYEEIQRYFGAKGYSELQLPKL